MQLMTVALVMLALWASPDPSGVTFKKGDSSIDVLIDGKPFTTYYYAPSQFKPYFHPVRAADGRIVTRHFPMEKDFPGEEKDKDHPHQRSLWFTFGDVDGVDYWAESAKVQGKIVQQSIDKLQEGKKGVIASTMDWIDNTGRKVLVHKQEVVLQGDATRRILDFTVRLTPVDRDVTFRDTKEGMFGVRLATVLKEARGTGTITNSKGGRTEKECWGKKAEWVDYSGTLEDKKVGITIMDHPDNLRHPTTWHVRAYGLFAVNPFGLRDFTGDKSQDGSHTIKRGDNLTFRYRVLIHDGDAAQAGLDQEYQKYLKEAR
jgi:hypothetical protein